MTPSLAIAGKWVLASGLAFLLVGSVLSDPTILLLGQVHIVLLVLAVMAIVPSALVLDRRLVRVEARPDGESHSGSGHVVGERERVSVVIHNPSNVALNHFKIVPFAATGITVSTPDGIVSVGPGQAVERDFYVTGRTVGRWVMHGFDVSVHDPFGLIETRDYLPAVHAFEFYPNAGFLKRRRAKRSASMLHLSGAHAVNAVGSGTEMRELRDWHSGDSLRDIAWKPSVRGRRLVSREFEREVTRSSYILLDISSSMRGGQTKGVILDYSIHLAVQLVDEVLRRNDRAGFMTFDEKLYGHITPGTGTNQLKRIMHHIVGLSCVVDAELTELDESDLYRLAADYALVQERLDFRKGDGVDSRSGVNESLMERWIASIMGDDRKRLGSPVLHEGVLSKRPKLVREFLQLRGVEVPYRVEARLGMKERGLVQAIEQAAQARPSVQQITVVSDLCGVLNVEPVLRAIRGLKARRVDVSFVVPFGPAFYEPVTQTDERFDVVRGLFTSAEADERARVVQRLRGGGCEVTMIRPSSSALAKRAVVGYAPAQIRSEDL